jgi:hypothetical protein
MPIYASPKVRDHARILAQRFNRAYTYLSGLLNIFLDIRLTLLSEQDWPHYVQVLRYGVMICDHPHQTLVSGAEPTAFEDGWHPAGLPNTSPGKWIPDERGGPRVYLCYNAD